MHRRVSNTFCWQDTAGFVSSLHLWPSDSITVSPRPVILSCWSQTRPTHLSLILQYCVMVLIIFHAAFLCIIYCLSVYLFYFYLYIFEDLCYKGKNSFHICNHRYRLLHTNIDIIDLNCLLQCQNQDLFKLLKEIYRFFFPFIATNCLLRTEVTSD